MSSWVCDFSKASQYLWGKLQNLDFSKLSKCQKLEEVSYEMLVLTLPHVSSCVSVAFLWLRSIYGGSCKTLTFRTCQSVKIGGSLVRNARFDAATCLLLCLCGFPLASQYLWGKLRTFHSTLFTPHFTLHTVHSTLYTPHFTLHTLHPPLYTPHFTLHT